MRKWLCLLILAAAGAVVLSSCNSLPAASDDYYEHVQTSMPIEKKYAGLGGWEVACAEYPCTESKYVKFEVWYPANIKSARKAFPLVVMANGTGVAASRYKAIFCHLASWGFIVVGNEDPESWDGRSSSLSLDFMLLQANKAGSIFYRKIDTQHIGIAGHSQGGVAVFNAVGRYAGGRRYKAAYAASCTQQSLSLKLKCSYKPSTMTIPCMLTAGTGPFDNNTIAPLASLRENLNGMPDSVPAVIARRSGKDHGDMLTEGDAYMTAWFCCWLKGDTSARGAFSEHGGEIRRNPRWQDVTVRNIR